jgi:hypothetical protein
MDTTNNQSVWTKPIGSGKKNEGMFSASSFMVGLVVFGVGTIVTGSIGIVLASIICTLGITLVVYIPVICLIGFAARKLWKASMQSMGVKSKEVPPSTEAVVNTQPVLTNSDIAIRNYIRESKTAGALNNDQIKQNLLMAGWAESQIDEAFKRCDS